MAREHIGKPLPFDLKVAIYRYRVYRGFGQRETAKLCGVNRETVTANITEEEAMVAREAARLEKIAQSG